MKKHPYRGSTWEQVLDRFENDSKGDHSLVAKGIHGFLMLALVGFDKFLGLMAFITRPLRRKPKKSTDTNAPSSE